MDARQDGRRSARRDQTRFVPGWVAILACLGALALAIVGPEAAAQPKRPAERGGEATAAEDAEQDDAGEDDAGEDDAEAEGEEAAQQPPPGGYTSGLYPMPDDAEVPLAWMPPGTSATPIPSDEIYPPQTITIRFNHKKHVKGLRQTCRSCHEGAYTSGAVTDRLLPRPAQTCDNCHDVDHSDLTQVKAGTNENGQCAYCHIGEDAGSGGKVAPLILPHANLRFPHKKHTDRNIKCSQCHGKVDRLELATREQLPRMAGCFTCHNMSGAAQGDAKSDCDVCHLTQPDGRLMTAFSTGDLLPPRWLHNAAHTPDWLERHKQIAANDSAFCGTCHTESYCTDCHDGKIRPRTVHPNDFLSMHPQAARQDNPRCVTCHQEQTFCADCHRRTGVARDAPSAARPAGRRFHPPPAEWTSAPRGAKHHAWEAERNLNACVSCHTERDCATCHATRGLSGGQGLNPHPLGFESKCRTALSRNPRPCLVCHQSNDSSLKRCR
ncbi:cytochrome c3 family protein [Sorangium sp. So ce1036]|uniref:cytochrome c3 family protein n=1 Tax=Sorangium sp. So ce1036 TaxID=3133328 RepID=UPI003F085040